MNRSRAMFLNTILLTATSLLMRSVGMAFQVYLSNKIGAAGIGLFQLIMSVSMLASTFAISGIRFATTRLVSEELGMSNPGGVKSAVWRCLIYAFCFGTAAAAALWFGADFIGGSWIHDTRTILSLRLLSMSLPAFAMSSVLSGYFTAVGRVIKSALVQVAEQLIRIAFVVAALTETPGGGVEYSCAVIVAGGIIGEVSSFLMLFALYLHDRRRYLVRAKKTADITKRMLSIAMPLAFSAYARTALSTLENLLVPRGLQKSGSSAESALADYGMIQGMVFPVITFPSAFFYSLAELLVPELTDAQVKGHDSQISATVSRILRLCLLFSLIVSSVMFFYSSQLGTAIYGSERVGSYIRLLSLLMPALYMDSVTDGMLRGLGQQLYSMKINILDSLISVALVWSLLPKYAVSGYIFMIYFTEIFNFSLSIHRLSVITKIDLSVACTLKSTFCAIGSVNVATLMMRLIGYPVSADFLSLTFAITAALLNYLLLLPLFGCVEKNDVNWLRTLFGIKKRFNGKTL